MLRVGVLVSGRGSNLAALLDAQSTGDLHAEIVLVLGDRPDAAALDVAQAHGVPTGTIPVGPDGRPDTDVAARRFADARVGLVVCAGYLRILPPTFLRVFPRRVINIHPSLLPAFPGLKAPGQALAAGVRVAGCTTHFVSEEVDAGPIIMQATVPVHADDTEATLADRILAWEHIILPASVRLFAQGRLDISGGRVTIKGASSTDDGFSSPGGVTP